VEGVKPYRGGFFLGCNNWNCNVNIMVMLGKLFQMGISYCLLGRMHVAYVEWAV